MRKLGAVPAGPALAPSGAAPVFVDTHAMRVMHRSTQGGRAVVGTAYRPSARERRPDRAGEIRPPTPPIRRTASARAPEFAVRVSGEDPPSRAHVPDRERK